LICHIWNAARPRKNTVSNKAMLKFMLSIPSIWSLWALWVISDVL
jgi:hypothetical protein